MAARKPLFEAGMPRSKPSRIGRALALACAIDLFGALVSPLLHASVVPMPASAKPGASTALLTFRDDDLQASLEILSLLAFNPGLIRQGGISEEGFARDNPVLSSSTSDGFQLNLVSNAASNPSIGPLAATAIYTWDGGGADNNVTTAANWVGNVVPTANSDIIWAGTTRLAVNIDAGGPARTYTFDNTAGAFVISGAAYTLSDGITNNSAVTQTINAAVSLTSAQTWNAATGNLVYGGNITNGGFLLTVAGSSNTTISGVLSGSGGLSNTGTGTVTLQGANTYTGATNISAGVVNIRNNTSLGTIAGGTTISSGATLQLQGTITVGSETLNIRGTGASGQTGALVNVSGTNDYGGLVTLAGNTTFSTLAGTLNITNAGTITGATSGLTLAGAGQGSITSIIGTTTGSLTKSGTGAWTLKGANTFTGATIVNGGTLTLAPASGSALGFTSSIIVNSGATLLLGAGNQIKDTAPMTLGGGTFARGTFSEGSINTAGVGTLSLTATSNLDFGTGSVGTLTFADFSPGGFALIIDNWTGTAATKGGGGTDRLIFNSDQSANLNSFRFTGYGTGAVEFNLGNGFFELVPVPESGLYLPGLLALAVILFHHRRQIIGVCCRRR
jgi:autotransporter-associated beta strand protein